MTEQEIEAVVDGAADAALHVVDSFVMQHRAAAIPALIGACVMWSVQHGGLDVVKGTLASASGMADALAGIRNRSAQ